MEPLLVGDSDSGGNVYDVVVQGIFAYIADTDMEDPGLLIVDISDLTSPTETGFFGTPGYVEAVAVVGDYAYVAGDDLWVVDVSDPANPVEVGFLDVPA